MRSVRRLLALSSLLAASLTACSGDTTNSFAPLGLSLTITPGADTIFVADTISAANALPLSVSASSLGHPVTTPGGIEWTSSDPSIASVSSTGSVVAKGIGSATITARINNATASANIAVVNRVAQLTVSATSFANLAGDTVQFTASALDPKGTLVPGTAYSFASADPTIATVTSPAPRTARVIFLKSGVANVTVRAGGQTASVSGSIQPREFISTPIATAPAGSLILSAGEDATCGILPLGRGYCFGRAGLLGVAKDTVCFNDIRPSTEGCTLIPLRIAGQLNFVNISVGDSVACGATADNKAYCWGSQKYGQLGNGVASGGSSNAPALVVGAASRTAVSLSRVSAGGNHACGLSPSGAAFCWGEDSLFQLGNGDQFALNSTTPIPVAGGNVFSSISAGFNHTCALTAAGVAMCWGDNSSGQLGAGLDDFAADTPSPISNVKFASISSGSYHSCGITAGGDAYCWGDNSSGQLGGGDAAPFSSNVPIAVVGGLHFKSISAGRFSTCGITTGGAAFCWGDNSYLQLGSASVFSSTSPTAVSGGHTDFTTVAVGVRHACAASSGGVYCWGSNVLGALGNEFQATRQATPTKTAIPQ
jgi:alpha-tubulin suppressor-like RCC1 family protein